MLEQIRSLIASALDERDAKQAAVEAILAAVESEGRSDLTEDETTKFDAARAELRSVDEKLASLEARKAELEEIEASKAKAAEARAELGTSPVVHVKRNEVTYRQDGGSSFFADLYNERYNRDTAAAERLNRHSAEMRAEHGDLEKRAGGTTGDFAPSSKGALVVPQYLSDLYAPNLRSGRPYLNTVRNLALPPEGLTMYIPTGVTKSTVVAQTSELTAVSNTSMGVTDISVPVNTYAGQNVLSRQAIERGMGIDSIVMADLISDYTTSLNVDCLNGAGTSGKHRGVLQTTNIATTNEIACTSTSAATLISKIADAIQRINSNRFLPAQVIVMHPRRWAALLNATDTSGRPLLGIEAGQQNVLGAGDAAAYGQVVGSVLGVPVVTDAGVPTSGNGTWATDSVIVTRGDDTFFWEDPGAPSMVRLEEIIGDTLAVKFVLYGYSAFTAQRYTNATYLITGTGLVAPTF